jgi:DUF1680 family protein
LGWFRNSAATLAGFVLIFASSALALVPEKIPPVVPDLQDFQNPDRVQLKGWIGSRIDANEGNRLAKLDTDRLLEGYRKRPGRQTWDGEHVGKWLHAATLAWVNTGDPALRKKLDYVATELVKCQLADGYLGTYEEKDRWTQWDVWAHKYNLIGLITYIRYTGNREPLEACRRMADLLCNTFGDEPGKRDIIPAGQHKGMAPTSVLEPMVLLYRFTGEPRYLDFCKYILRAWEHPNGPKIISTLLKDKRVDEVGDGKAYEMLSCLNGALEYYRTTGDHQIFEACQNAWQDIVAHKLYLTGTASYREFFHDDFDLPNVNNVGETCVTVTWLQFNAQLLRLTGEARFAEQLERVVLNQLFGAQCPDGTAWGYYVQMQGKKPYSSSLDGHCCLSSGPRGVSLIPTFAVSSDNDGVVFNLYEAGHSRITLHDNTSVALISETEYPSDDQIRITVKPSAKTYFAIKLRIPAWCSNPKVEVNGQETEAKLGLDGYAALRREWKSGDKIQLRFKLEPREVVGTHQNEGRIAIEYGPLVLAADESLLDPKDSDLNAIGFPGRDLAALHVTPEPAPAKFKTWADARVFRVNAISRDPAEPASKARRVQIRLVPFADAGETGSAYRIWLPYEPLPADRNLLQDGVEIRSRKPNAGSIIDGNLQTIALTFNQKRAPQDWFGVELEVPATIARVVFVHGKTFHDGGWFDASAKKPQIQIQKEARGTWETVGELREYPATSSTDPAGLKGGERFSCQLPKPLRVFGVRVLGQPASGDNSKQAFSSCGELQAFSK